MKNYALLYAQSGGPTSVINASAYGVITEAKKRGIKTYVALNGIEGLLKGSISDIDNESDQEIEKLRYTPASAFGSCRVKLPIHTQDKTQYEKILEIFKKLNIHYFVYNGGNDSMNTCSKIADFMQESGYECYVCGVPKTIDNDLLCTDHCPGYGSAAKFIATACSEIALDTNVYAHGRITVVEIMGRDAGWLTASSALASAYGTGPDLIYLPERPFDIEDFCVKCKNVYMKKHSCLVAVSEGIRDVNGKYICSYATEEKKDMFNNTQLGGVGIYLANLLTQKTGIKTRAIELSLMQRCAAHIASLTDNEEAVLAGRKAVEAVSDGITNKMVTFKRESNSPYKMTCSLSPLCDVAHGTQSMPDEFIGKDCCSVTDKFIAYATPLIMGEVNIKYENGLPVFASLKNKIITF
ncbi:MAG: 6-phosphofructokinase [Clostridia bacterium]|nr:6-phosphofructokinase [Clostridia bacterium]